MAPVMAQIAQLLSPTINHPLFSLPVVCDEWRICAQTTLNSPYVNQHISTVSLDFAMKICISSISSAAQLVFFTVFSLPISNSKRELRMYAKKLSLMNIEYLHLNRHDVSAHPWRVERQFFNSTFSLSFSTHEGHPMTWDAYHRLANIYTYMDYLTRTYPSLCSQKEIGKSHEGRSLKVLKISDGKPTNKAVWVDAGIHAWVQRDMSACHNF